MNPENIIEMQNQITALSEVIADVQKTVAALKINEQMYLKSNSPIPPGIACKVAYDANGLIIDTSKLTMADIPDLQIDKIIGLRKILDSAITEDDLARLKSEIVNISIKKDVAIGTGTKVNFDKNGFIVSASDLTADDIPDIPIIKVEGLSEILEYLKSQHNPIDQQTLGASLNDIKVEAGTYTKVAVDNNGRVVSGQKLTIDDIPNELISKINMIESNLPNLASQLSVNSLIKSVSGKLDANGSPIIPGVYTKVKVDSKGLVLSGDKLTKEDLPDLSISDINGLEKILGDKADHNDIVALNESVSMLTNSMSNIGEVLTLKNQLIAKADSKDVREINTRLSSLQKLTDTLSTKIPNELIMEQLQQIQNDLSTLSGRISVLERKLNMEDNFDKNA